MLAQSTSGAFPSAIELRLDRTLSVMWSACRLIAIEISFAFAAASPDNAVITTTGIVCVGAPDDIWTRRVGINAAKIGCYTVDGVGSVCCFVPDAADLSWGHAATVGVACGPSL